MILDPKRDGYEQVNSVHGRVKRDAVTQCGGRGYAVSEVAERLGISTTPLYTWKAQFSKVPHFVNHPFLVSGFPRYSMIRLRLRMTFSAGKEMSTSMPKTSRLKSSSTLNSPNARPSTARSACLHAREGPRRSAIKSIDHVMFGASGTANASSLSRFRRLRGLMRRINFSSE